MVERIGCWTEMAQRSIIGMAKSIFRHLIANIYFNYRLKRRWCKCAKMSWRNLPSSMMLTYQVSVRSLSTTISTRSLSIWLIRNTTSSIQIQKIFVQLSVLVNRSKTILLHTPTPNIWQLKFQNIHPIYRYYPLKLNIYVISINSKYVCCYSIKDYFNINVYFYEIIHKYYFVHIKTDKLWQLSLTHTNMTTTGHRVTYIFVQ